MSGLNKQDVTQQFTIISLSVVALLFAGCGQKVDDTWYVVPKQEQLEAEAQNPHTGTAPPSQAVPQQSAAPFAPFAQSGGMANQTLPEDMVNSGDLPQWTLPEGWQKMPDRPMRAATLAAGEGDSAIEVSITSFPGDVGGLTNNINRWRRQLGLPPEDDAAVSASLTELKAGNQIFQLLELVNNGDAMRVAITMHAGNSWFFKMTGPAASIDAQREAFDGFIKSIRY